ncbi:MAG TPA: efflux RND transporter periplasmic adaptor subunit [Mariniphaga sp.]|nr:efflux RND transporter periplasmic adaptor subunit [Mariniphaga sp.]
MKQKKLTFLGLAILAILIVLLIIGKKAGLVGKEYELKVAVQKVAYKTITEHITANGKIQPKTEVKISPDVSGEVIELYVMEGDQVNAGDLLCVIKPDLYMSALSRAEAALNSSKARLAQTQAQQIERELAYNRTKQLFDSGAIPVSDYETAEAAFKVVQAEVRAAEYTVKSAEASVEEAREQLTKTRIYAPIAGTISALNVERGERVVGTNMYAGTEMMIVADLNEMEVLAQVNENDIVKVSLNDTAFIEVDAYLNKKFKGIVTEIANSARLTGNVTDQVTNFDVKILLIHDSYASLIDSTTGILYPFRPGMSATVDVLTNKREKVVSVPIAAVTTRVMGKDTFGRQAAGLSGMPVAQDERSEVVFVNRDGRARIVKVKSGIQDNMNIEIEEGLAEGDEVITAPYHAVSRTLQDSILIEIVSENELFSGK